MTRKSLGRGLDYLIGASTSEGQKISEIDINDVRPNPRQPRAVFREEEIEKMADSIREFGVVQPVIVRPVGTEYELIAGERRLRAARLAGIKKIPAIIRETGETDSLEIALIENIHRSDLNGIEEATAYQQLIEDFGITHEELAKKIGKSRAAITNTLRLLQLPEFIKQGVMEGSISTGHARALLALQDEQEVQRRLAERIIEDGISVRRTEEIVRRYLTGRGAAKRKRIPAPQEALVMLERIESFLGSPVSCVMGKRKSKIVIEFRNKEELAKICEKICGVPAAGGEGGGGGRETFRETEGFNAGKAGENDSEGST